MRRTANFVLALYSRSSVASDPTRFPAAQVTDMLCGAHTRVVAPAAAAATSSGKAPQKRLGAFFAAELPFKCASCGDRMAIDTPLCERCSREPNEATVAVLTALRGLRMSERVSWQVTYIAASPTLFVRTIQFRFR